MPNNEAYLPTQDEISDACERIQGTWSELERVAESASKNSNLFHDPSCSSVGRIKDTNKIWFNNQEEAAAAGYSPSKCTRELLGI